MEEARELYAQFAAAQPDFSLFMTPGWLDAVTDGNWQPMVFTKGEEIQACWPLTLRQRLGFRFVEQPPLTPHAGPWITYHVGQSQNSRLNYEKSILTDMISRLPRFDRFRQSLHPRFTNWLPFYWSGFSQTTRYTYILPDLSNIGTMWNGMATSVRARIRKAGEQFVVRESSDTETYFGLYKALYTNKKVNLLFDAATLKRMHQYCLKINCGKLFSAQDKDGNIVAMLMLVWDKTSSYYLSGVQGPRQEYNGVMNLLLWHAIRYSSEIGLNRFDFEGSMIEGVEQFFRSFGAIQQPYFELTKTQSRILRLREAL